MKMKKRFFCIVLALVLLCVGAPLTAHAEDDTSDYTPVYTKEDLDNIRLNMSGKYILMNDIIFTDDDFKKGGDFYNSGKGWSPIGTSTSSFRGAFEGNKYGIYNLKMTFPDENGIGLFGYVSGVSINNLTVTGDLVGKGSCGLIIGSGSGINISNCKAMGSVTATDELTGGLVGIASDSTSSIQNCFFKGEVFGKNRVGGIVGEISSRYSYPNKIVSCLSMGSVSGTNYVGGICGYVGGGVDSSPTNDETITHTFSFNENRAEVTGEKAVGGLLGFVYASYSVYTRYKGTVFVGQWHQYSYYNISNCFNRGPISASKENVGGVVGEFSGNSSSKSSVVSKVYNVGKITSEGSKGAITSGGTRFSISEGNVFYLDECIENGNGNYGISKSEDQLRKQSTYENWNFETVWSIDKDAEYRYPTLCGVSDQSEIVIPSNCQHKHTQLQNEKKATCLENGYTGDVVCLDCSETLELGIILSPLGHTPQTYTTPSTCAENGFTITICTRCGETLSKEILQRLEHTWTSEVTQNPTCTAQGVKTYTCESCGETYTEPVDVLAHQWDDGKMTKAPSCTEAGEMTYTCGIGGETRTEPIDKLDHEIVLVAGKAATCTEPGLTDGWQCKQCKKWFAEQQEIAALDHDPQIGKVVEPTCEGPGYTPFVCTRCGETISKTDPTDALGHDMQPTYVWAKDDSTVTATMVCTRCDKTGMTETAKVKTEVTVKPTCSTEGELTLIAAFNNKSFYGQVKTKTLPRDPDAHVFRVTVTPPTCIDEGYTTHACTLCRYGYADEIVPPTGHTPVTDDAVPATCEAPGLTEGSHCSVCGDVLTPQEETPMLDHADADNDGLCDTCGNQMIGDDHCKYCGKVHDGAFGWLIRFFHNILAIFKR